MSVVTGTTLPARRSSVARVAPSTLASTRRSRLSYCVLVGLGVFLFVFLAPFLVVVVNAFKTPSDLAAHGPIALPRGWHLSTIVRFWNLSNFGSKLINSLQISLAVAVFGVLLSLLNSYALGIGRLRGRGAFLVFFLLANVLPQEGLVYPLYYISKTLHLYDTKLAVIIIFTAIQSAFGTYLLSSVFASFPRELLEAAAIDGATRWRTLWSVVFPISRPTLAVLFTFFFIWTWNEFFLPLVFLVSNKNQTVPISLALLRGQYSTDVTATAASALLGIVPAMLFFLLFQRTLTRGVAAGAVK